MKPTNTLFPIFLRTDRLHILIIGGGSVAEEKLHFLFKNSPDAHVTVVAPEISDAVLTHAGQYDISFHHRKYESTDIELGDLVIAATDRSELNQRVRKDARSAGKLINVADKPDLCDFYLGGVVTKGDVKIAISTNGKSPTLAKRLRQLLEKNLPDELNVLANHLHRVRPLFGSDFKRKVEKLNTLTETLIEN
ncbi:bifunctional precorrin-2 dehydrogenase/sirohydrochlorin ferrochelatase [Membranicola marinus]|uniref:precorrin-2 dehydrogenase n=1 Tax=Membranihabitans marinus TaxID=1227546 RepID=A0A953LAQ2_9BACT|nr:bifunctional precorrin-2 dehydrogenase/sirohydrochlorin ferrochelatase [Membranihabitans marinus]MBY5958933.1 bifunctional precorrin-2 dehydrogenase/sirohydrochlorin ferrochelatase [Membranihabitans marinus]